LDARTQGQIVGDALRSFLSDPRGDRTPSIGNEDRNP
jgi:hypothetical protein